MPVDRTTSRAELWRQASRPIRALPCGMTADISTIGCGGFLRAAFGPEGGCYVRPPRLFSADPLHSRVSYRVEPRRRQSNDKYHPACFMRAPASASGQPADEQSGVWVALRSAGGHVLYHRVLRTPHPDSLEVFEDEKTGAIRRVLTARPQVMKLDLIVPDLPDASELTLYGPKDPSEPDKPSVPLLQSPMRELRLRATTPPQ